MDMETARGFEIMNQSYDWKRNTRRAQALQEQGYSWDYDATGYIVFCNRTMVAQDPKTIQKNILDNFLMCLRVAEAHLWRSK